MSEGETSEKSGGGEIPVGEQELVAKIQQAALGDSSEVGAKIRAIALEEGETSPSETPTTAPVDLEKQGQFSKRLTALRRRYLDIPKHHVEAYQKTIDEAFQALQECHEQQAYDSSAPLFSNLEKELSKAETLIDERGRYSVEVRQRRRAAQDIPQKWLGEVDKLFDKLLKCYEKSQFDATPKLFEQLDKAIESAGQTWIEDVRGKVDDQLESALTDAPEDCVSRLTELDKSAKNLVSSGSLVDAASTLEELLDYIQFVIQEKARIEKEREERLRLEAEAKERRRQLTVAQNTLKINELTAEYAKYAQLLNGVSSKAAAALLKVVELCKTEVKKLDLSSETAGKELEDVLFDSLEDSLGGEFYTAISYLDDYKDSILSTIDEDSEDDLQVELREIWDKVKDGFEQAEYDDLSDLFDGARELLWKLEGAGSYDDLLEEVRPEYERVESDPDAWMPTEVAENYDAADDFRESAKFSQGMALLRKVKAQIPKIDGVTKRHQEVKPDFENAQKSKATKEQKKAIQKLLDDAKKLAQDGDSQKAIAELNKMVTKIQEVAAATDRRTDPNKFPNIVAKGAKDGGMKNLGTVATKLSEGGMSSDEVMKLIPKGAKQNWKVNPNDPNRYKSGFKYEWTDKDGNEYHIHGHTKDSHHSDDTNSGSGSVVRIRINGQWLKSDGTTTDLLTSEMAHIPLF